jgi:hypothetical protein
VSVEAVAWALNLAPVPVDSGGKPNSACAFVLVGLASHATRTGQERSRPSRRSRGIPGCRSGPSGLYRLESARVIMPCAGDYCARMRRADRRPQGWDLDVSLIRDDLIDAEIAGLKRQFPGLRERIAAARSAQTLVFDGV